ncbi:MAG TPA: glycosyltransferase family 1 protein [bacterium]|nr:glycosyltransferase family 1 protein [bacterium]
MRFLELNVLPNLPEKLKPLLELSNNVWWAWDSEAFALFRDIDPDLWSETLHNPVKFIYRLSQDKLNEIASDDAFMNRIDTTVKRLNAYLSRPCWYDKIKNEMPPSFSIAYFSLEFGLAECLPIYSGGLGVLAGDHLKSASDLGLPLNAVGLLYSVGYFHQYLTNDGWQQEKYVVNDYNIAPVNEVKKDGSFLVIDVKFPHGVVKAMVWKVQVGRVSLYLLDTNLPENSDADKEITARLYGGDLEMRIKQEYLLGIGGIMALEALGITPSVTHMNEGHSAFLALERIRLLMQKHSLSFSEAREVTAASSVFTTHTPVPAGNDRFPKELMEKYLKEYVEKNLKISFSDFIKMGRVLPEDENEWFCMTVLALNLSAFNNGVSRLHGRVSREMWKEIWPDVPLNEIPITHITNGVHGPSWISKEFADLFFRYMGTRWIDNPEDASTWKRVAEIPDTELWRTHERRKDRLVAFVRRKLNKQLSARKSSGEDLDRAGEVLSPEALTIGFARRFATYKRANLILKDVERLRRILTDDKKPVQVIFAGKAHPKDDAGKEFIREIVHAAEKDGFRDRIVFLEDYDLNTAHYLVQGVDVWMNNPRRPLEASGTSGMKVNFNGGLNFSVMDGWWDEKPDADNGWMIGRGEEYDDQAYQDGLEASSIYETLENDIIPLYYKRGKDGLPHEWIKKMKTSMQTLCPVFNTDRMVIEYSEKFYKPTGLKYFEMSSPGFEKAKALSKWREKVRKHWPNVKIIDFTAPDLADIPSGGSITVKALVESGGLSHEDINTEIYYGFDRAGMDLSDTNTVKMNFAGNENGLFIYEGVITPPSTGKIRFTVRALPQNTNMTAKFMPGYIKWCGA